MSTTLHSFVDIFNTRISDSETQVQLNKIVIPIIQRDYAQGRNNPEVNRVRSRFLNALYEAVNGDPITLDFIYGDVDQDGSLIPLDGQQRLTTLFLLHWYAAKKESIPEEDWQFLRGFSYRTRVSSRDFCSELVAFDPSFGRPIREDIINQPWFPLEWKKDPTVDAMLTMLNEIEERFGEVTGLWNKLCEGAITFYLLPIRDMGLTDELYIKMNSRGKPLTEFEHFKAELEKEMEPIDSEMTKRVISKFDREWMDLLWDYRDSGDKDERDETTDDEFLRFFRYVCDVICFKSGESPQGRGNDALDLVHRYFSSENPDACANMATLEKAFDCWCDIPGYDSPDSFLETFLNEDGYEKGKIYVGSATLFRDCLGTYSEMSGRQRLFPLGHFVLLYAISFYLQHLNEISEDEFIRRIRIINNLVDNSEDEIVDRTERNRIPAILDQTEAILLTGLIDDSIKSGFNAVQIKEEKEKIEYLREHPEDQDTLFRLEDNDLLYGQIGIIGLDHLDLADKFNALFENDWDKVDRALMATGNYLQKENDWRYQAGSKGRRDAWYALFHRSRNKGFENTSQILVEMLTGLDPVDDAALDAVANKYIEDCEGRSRFPWEYYYVKYPSFRPGSFGKIANLGEENENYLYAVMQTKSNFSENTYIPYLMEADPDKVDRDYYGKFLTYCNRYIACEDDAFAIYGEESNEVLERITIEQDENGIDTEDRIIKLKEYIKDHPGM